MTPRERLVVHTGPISLADAEALMTAHKIKKLPLVNAGRHACSGSSPRRICIKHRRHPFATRDERGGCAWRPRSARPATTSNARPRCCAPAPTRWSSTSRTGIRWSWSGRSSRSARRFGGVELVAGNVATAEGARFLLERGVNAIKVGIGPGGGCTTRLTTNFGVPQVEALVQCAVGRRRSRAAHRRRRHPARRRHRRRRCCSAANRSCSAARSPAPRRRPARSS